MNHLGRVAVLGGGSFGTALAHLCGSLGASVTLWCRRAEQARVFNDTHRGHGALDGYAISHRVYAACEARELVEEADTVFYVATSQALREVLEHVKSALHGQSFVIAAKGIEVSTGMLMTEVTRDVVAEAVCPLVLSGPSFAQGIVAGDPTAVVLAGKDVARVTQVADGLFCDSFRTYASDDEIGVQLGGALKNVLAIAAGTLESLGLGPNTRAALITRGVSEISKIAQARGANPKTLAGLAGVGDVVLTCTSGLSRNYTLGKLLGSGCTLEEATAKIGTVAEGVKTAEAAHAFAQKLGVEAPIMDAVYQVLYEEKPVSSALLELVRRRAGFE